MHALLQPMSLSRAAASDQYCNLWSRSYNPLQYQENASIRACSLLMGGLSSRKIALWESMAHVGADSPAAAKIQWMILNFSCFPSISLNFSLRSSEFISVKVFNFNRRSISSSLLCPSPISSTIPDLRAAALTASPKLDATRYLSIKSEASSDASS